jgi:hypothetical protein
MLKSISLTAGGGNVSRRKRFGPDVYSWPWINNTALQLALSEAAATGLVLGMGAPGGEENWLRGVRQGPLATGVTGATYARSGTRAGFDPANLFAPNVVRREAGRGVRVFGAGTNLCFSSENLQAGGWITADGAAITSAIAGTLSSTLGSRILQTNATTVTGSTNTVSVTLSGSGTVNLRNRDGSGAFGGTNLSVVLTSTPTRYSVTRTSADNGTTLVIENQSGVAVTNLQIRYAQIEASTFATDYIPNASTVASASAGADDLAVGTGAGVTLGPDHAFIIEGTVPNLLSGAFPGFLGWNASSASVGIYINSGGQCGVNAGGGTISASGPPTLTKGQTVRALFRVSGGNTGRLFVNGVATLADTAFTPSTGLASFFIGQAPSKINLLGSGLSIVAVLLRAPSDAECLAITAP